MFYGWIVVGIAFAAQFTAVGLIYYTFGVVLKELAVEFDSGRFGISAIHLVMPWTTAVMAPILGRLAGAGYLRSLIFAGAVATGVGFCLISQARELWHLYVIYPVLMSFGTNCLSGVGAQTLVVNWFSERRATALGLSQIGASAGGMVMGPLAAVLFAEHSWRDVYLGFGLCVLVLAPVLGWFVVGRPEERGLSPYGVEPGDGRTVSGPPPSQLSAGQALRLPNLWRLAFIAGVGSMLSGAMVTHVVAFATDSGIPPLEASGLLSVMALGAVAGKLVFGYLADRFGERAAYILALAVEGIGLASLTAEPTGTLLFAVMLFFGLGVGGNLPLSAALLTRVFGPAAFGPMLGLKSLLAMPLVAVGTPFAGWIFDLTGSYNTAFAVFAGLAGVAIIAVWAVSLPTRDLT